MEVHNVAHETAGAEAIERAGSGIEAPVDPENAVVLRVKFQPVMSVAAVLT